MKVVVMGYPGSGKSWLTAYLSEQYALPALQLDEVAFDRDWKPLDRAGVLPQIAAFLEQEHWVIDGNYDGYLLEERLAAADHIVLLLFPRHICLWRAVKRSSVRRAAGYTNDLNLRFLRFVLFGSRTRTHRAWYARILRQYPERVTVLRNRRQLTRFLARFP